MLAVDTNLNQTRLPSRWRAFKWKTCPERGPSWLPSAPTHADPAVVFGFHRSRRPWPLDAERALESRSTVLPCALRPVSNQEPFPLGIARPTDMSG